MKCRFFIFLKNVVIALCSQRLLLIVEASLQATLADRPSRIKNRKYQGDWMHVQEDVHVVAYQESSFVLVDVTMD